MKYPKNKFEINLPSLEVEKRNERRRQKGILKDPSMLKVLDSSRRADLKAKIKTFLDLKQKKGKSKGASNHSAKKGMAQSHSDNFFRRHHFMNMTQEERLNRRLNDEMLRTNKSMSRQFSEERQTL